MKKTIITIILSVLCVTTLLGQNKLAEKIPVPDDNQVSIGAVEVSNKASRFKIAYNIKFGKNVRNCNVNLRVSNDGGKNFYINPKREFLSGDIGKISQSGDKEIRYDISSDKNMLINRDVVFDVYVTNKDILKLRTFILGQFDISGTSGGLMVGLCRTVGGYVKATSNFTLPLTYVGKCDSQGSIIVSESPKETSGNIWSSGLSKKSRLTVTGGLMLRAAKFLYPYIGLGYGGYNVFIQDSTGNWFKETDNSITSVSADAGFIWNIKHFSFSTGVNTVGFKKWNFSIGIGCSF